MATAELAVAMPALLLVLAVLLSAISLGIDEVRCVDAARVGVRLLARGESQEAALRESTATAPAGALVSVGAAAGRVSVSVTGRSPAMLGWLGVPLRPSATAVAAREVEGGS